MRWKGLSAASVRAQADFVDELDYLLPDLVHGLDAVRGGLVILPDLAFNDRGVRFQELFSFELVEDGVECAGGDIVAVMAELFYKPKAIDVLLVGVIKDMDLYYPEKKIPQHLGIGSLHVSERFPGRNYAKSTEFCHIGKFFTIAIY